MAGSADQACPDTSVLAAFHAGRLTGPVWDIMAAHFEGCGSCLARLDAQADETDELVRALRAPEETTCTSIPRRERILRLLRPIGRQAPPAPPGYEILETLGQGGMGQVYRGRDLKLNRIVAIKVLLPRWLGSETAHARFLREARTMASLKHPNLVAVHGLEVIDGIHYLIMEFVEGESLRARLDQEGTLPVLDILTIGRDVARGLAAAHAAGVIHRDVKPANILLDRQVGLARLADFGLARGEEEEGLTQPGMVAGTPGYMAPEQDQGEWPDARADLFSLGRVLWAASVGRPNIPVGQMTTRRPDLPAGLVQLIERLLARQPELRPANAALVADELDRLGRSAPWHRRARGIRGAALFLIVFAGLLGLTRLAPSRAPEVMFQLEPTEAARTWTAFPASVGTLPPLRLRAGETLKTALRVDRRNTSSPIRVTLTGLPDGVFASPVILPANQNEAAVNLHAYRNAEPGPRESQLLLTCEDNALAMPLSMTVDPPAPIQAFQMTLRGLGDLEAVAPVQAPASWRREGVVAGLKGKGTLLYPPLPWSSYALELELELSAPGSRIVFFLGDLPERWLAEITLDREDESGRLRCRAVRRKGGQWFTPGVRWLPDRPRARLTFVVTADWTGIYHDGERIMETPAGPNLRVRLESPLARTDGTLYQLLCRPVSDRETVELRVLPPRD